MSSNIPVFKAFIPYYPHMQRVLNLCSGSVPMVAAKNINCTLIVNDPVEIEIFQMALEDRALNIVCTYFTSYKKADELFKKQELLPDCIIIDSDMGDVGRKECLEKIKRIPYVAKVPVVIFAGLLSDSEKARLTALGTFGFIPKANSVNELKNNLHYFFTGAFAG